ncbi:hypothetical protein FRB94_012416 [Tulasnella sp. JGI-2019a]|nr:hypothetical protein FRB93_010455 [Tulasnella sp. JGI-2019a]KAG9009144.1 hypothetical protein FRB94_012416 [Tulasnella sp. JGI-2019a]KAG9038351.1 hypothetical protein FRB95_001763 [Tulasnella sp. JGI-2019a]
MSSGWLSVLSNIIGWTYFFSWSLSFYPQAILNYRRKRVDGFSIDFATLNSLAFACYAIYNVNFYSNPSIREAYRQRHGGKDNSVMSNDVAFAVHAFVLSTFTLLQTWWYPRGEKQRVSTYHRVVIAIFFTLAALDTTLLLFGGETGIDFLYHLSYFKLYVSTAKYIPQAVTNYKRKSTVGFSIEGMILDLSGGLLSLIQSLLIAHMDSDWSSVIGNPVKFGLSLLAMCFPTIYIVQHFILYRGREPEENVAKGPDDQPLLSEDSI